MDLYAKFVKFAYSDKCYWYRDALVESKKSQEHYLVWLEHLRCGGNNQFCRDFTLNPNSDLEEISLSLPKVKGKNER